MRLRKEIADKIEPRLRSALLGAKRHQLLRVLMELGPVPVGPPNGLPNQPPTAVQFPSLTDFRRALIEHQKAELAHAIGGTVETLRSLALVVKGGETGRTVTVVGPAHRISKALQLTGVVHATLDQDIGQIEPHRRGRHVSAS